MEISPRITTLKEDFPFFYSENKKLSYLDSAATALKPKSVIAAISHYYENLGASVHRGAYKLGDDVTSLYEKAREESRNFLGAKNKEEIIFTSGTTHSLNLVAFSLGEYCLKEGDEVLVTASEHHANFIPWQQIAKRKGAHFRVIPLDHDFRINLKKAKELMSSKTKILAFSHVSNVLGGMNPVKELIDLAQSVGAYTVVDGAQWTPHGKVSVTELNCDFYTFSAHKIMGPTGVGVLYGKKELLEKMPPYQTGGNMIATVNEKESTWNMLPNKFEAGTPNIAGVIGMIACYEYIKKLNQEEIMKHEKKLTKLLLHELNENKNITTYEQDPLSLVSFSHKTIHPHDISFMADSHGVCIRSGHLCAQPLMQTLGVSALSRASFYFYSDETDVERLLRSLHEAETLFS